MRGYPKGFLTFLLIIMAITFISGILILPQAFDLKFAILLPNPVPEKYSILLAFLHGTASIIFIFIIGSLWAYHMRQGWRKKENIISGLGLCFCFAALFISAMGLYYLSNDASLAVASIIHISIGIIIAIVFAIHYLHFMRKSKPVNTI